MPININDILDSENWEYLLDPKKLINNVVTLPNKGKKVSLAGTSIQNPHFSYNIYIYRGRYHLFKTNLHHRCTTPKILQLIRLDLDFQRSHENPDGITITQPHLHLFSEIDPHGKWAIPLDDPLLIQLFPNFSFDDFNSLNLNDSFTRFLRLCNFNNTVKVNTQESLF